MRFDLQFIKRILDDVSILNESVLTEPTFIHDSRLAKSSDIFVAISGERIDGHDFIEHAFSQGAQGVLMSVHQRASIDKIDPILRKNKVIICVPDPVHALISLASAWRKQFSYPVIGITGSVGKTSVKAMIAHILSAAGKSYYMSPDNQSTQIDLAVNVLNMRAYHEYALFELGINRRGDMDALVDIVRPTTAIITNIGHSHMEGLGSTTDIALEKRQIFKHFSAENIGIIHGDQPLLTHVAYHHPVIKFGLKTTNQVQARKMHITSTAITCLLKVYKNKCSISLPIPHQGILQDVLAAVAATHYFGIPFDTIQHAIQKQIIVKRRFETRIMRQHAGMMIDDGYNANPESVKAALLAFSRMETTAQKVIVLGDMLELGVTSPFWHRQIGRFLSKVSQLKKVILVGSLVKWTEKTMPIGVTMYRVPSWKEAIDQLSKELTHDTLVLVKGSLDMELGRLVDYFTA